MRQGYKLIIYVEKIQNCHSFVANVKHSARTSIA